MAYSPITYMMLKSTKSETSEVPHINSANVHGEPWTGYEAGENKGEFECENCTFFERETSSCGQSDMMLHSKLAKVAGSERVIVDPEGCCEYVDRKGIEDKETKETE